VLPASTPKGIALFAQHLTGGTRATRGFHNDLLLIIAAQVIKPVSNVVKDICLCNGDLFDMFHFNSPCLFLLSPERKPIAGEELPS
jgi:hypothetical protein